VRFEGVDLATAVSDHQAQLSFTDFGLVHGTEPMNRWLVPGRDYLLRADPNGLEFELRHAGAFSGGRGWRCLPSVKQVLGSLGLGDSALLSRSTGIAIRVEVLQAGTEARLEVEEISERASAGAQPSIRELQQAIGAFVNERDWRKFHSPRNLASALTVEAAELLEHFLWLSEDESRMLDAAKLEQVGDEIGDVLIYLLRLADELGLDVIDAAARKLERNRQKYPADKVRGDARKYDEY
jgi:dCTP diphosphatase